MPPLRRFRGPQNVGHEYDRWTTDGILEHYWGEHIHHGYYAEGRVSADFKARQDLALEATDPCRQVCLFFAHRGTAGNEE